MKINLLDSSVYNRISAGEVIENPASVVKELAENCVDAGASAISIYIEDGGMKSAEVIDNGCGIEKDELPKAVLPHATSKISDVADLDTISTLGFRGEALASIAAVSELQIKSRAGNAENGALLSVKGDKVTLSDIAYNRGTGVKVANLFYNTPARFKFLGSKPVEEGAITRYVTRLILSNPSLAVSYYTDGKLMLASSGGGEWEAVNAVFPPETVKNLIKFDETVDDLRIYGHISNPNISKNNRSSQHFILNGRLITDPVLTATVQNAYGERLMRRCFPIFVINIIMPFGDADVNVHPTKAEVRFANHRKVAGAVYRAVKLALDGFDAGVGDELFKKSEEAENAPKPAKTPEICSPAREKTDRGLSFAEALSMFSVPKVAESSVAAADDGAAPVLEIVKPKADPIFNKEASKEAIYSQNTTMKSEPLSYRTVGQLFGTYLIVESGDKVLFFDQHAVHERLIYDSYFAELVSGAVAVQPFLVPFIFEGTREEIEALSGEKEELLAAGIELELFGNNAIKVSSLPALLSDADPGAVIAEIADGILRGGRATLTELGKEKLAMSACKAAIKGNCELSAEQVELIMGYFTAGAMPTRCPHGRPTFITYTKSEFEKLFKRRL